MTLLKREALFLARSSVESETSPTKNGFLILTMCVYYTSTLADKVSNILEMLVTNDIHFGS
jgi:hypothetical protein